MVFLHNLDLAHIFGLENAFDLKMMWLMSKKSSFAIPTRLATEGSFSFKKEDQTTVFVDDIRMLKSPLKILTFVLFPIAKLLKYVFYSTQ